MADVRVDDRETALRTLFPEGATPSDAEVLLAAWRRWGEECTSRIQGDFAFVVVDLLRRRLFAACDAFGVKPLHFARSGSVIVVASEAQQILRYPGMPTTLDLTTVANFLACRPEPPSRSFFRHVSRIPGGHFLTCSPRHSSVRRWWDPETRHGIRHRRSESYALEYREILRQAVADRLRAGGTGIGVFLSGGLDSGTVVTLAADQSPRDSPSLLPLTYEFHNFAECSELDFSQPLCRQLGLTLSRFPLDQVLQFDNPAALPTSIETPFLGWEHAHHSMRRFLRERGARVVLTGMVGEYAAIGHDRLAYPWRLLRGDSGVLREVLRRGRRFGWSSSRTILNMLLKPLLPDPAIGWVRQAVGRGTGPTEPEWLSPRLAALYHASMEPAAPTGLSRLLQRHSLASRRRFLLPEGLPEILYWHDRGCAPFGIEVRHPLLDRRLVEYSARIPPEEIFRAGWDRIVVRRAMRGLLPEKSRLRTDKTMFTPYVEAGLRALLTRTPDSEIRRWCIVRTDLVSEAVLLKVIADCRTGVRPCCGLLGVVLLEIWLAKNRRLLQGVG